jgi:hypothetical protein
MEFMLHWWDELDDWAHACRHVAVSAFSEIAEASLTLTAGLSAFLVWMLRPGS